jgi:beta-N-acetylhexosaminidase
LTGAGVISPSFAAPKTNLPQPVSDIGEMLVFGFDGDTVTSPSARIIANDIRAGLLGGAFFVKGNVGSRDHFIKLVCSFTANAPAQPLIAIDHEGGNVQRLVERHGFTKLPSARLVAAQLSPDQAKELYAKAGRELVAIGVNLNLAPVVDLHDPGNPQIGHFDRAFDADVARIVTYAEAFVAGFSSAGVGCVLKHFPGEGHCTEDSHAALPDISATWSMLDLEPFARLIADNRAKVIMNGHVRVASVEKQPVPVTLSRAATTSLLREKLGFQGVIITDDIDMLSVNAGIERREGVIRAIAAGNDLLMIRNVSSFDEHLAENIANWVHEAISNGILSATSVAESVERVRKFKRTLGVTPPQ